MAERDAASRPADSATSANTHDSSDMVSFSPKGTSIRMYKQAIVCFLDFLPLDQQRLLTGVSREWRAAADSSTAGKAWHQVSRLSLTAGDDFSAAVARMNIVRRANGSQRRQQLLAGWQQQLCEAGCLTAGQPLLQLLQSAVVTRSSLSDWGSTGNASLTLQPPAIAAAFVSAAVSGSCGAGPTAASANWSNQPRPPPVQWYLHWSYEMEGWTRDLRWCVSPSAASTQAGTDDAALLVDLCRNMPESRSQRNNMRRRVHLMLQLLLRWGVLRGDEQQQATLLQLCLEALHKLACFESTQFHVLYELLDSFDHEDDWISAAVADLQRDDEHGGKAQHIADLDDGDSKENGGYSGYRKRQRRY